MAEQCRAAAGGPPPKGPPPEIFGGNPGGTSLAARVTPVLSPDELKLRE
jgi:hypothetical protein